MALEVLDSLKCHEKCVFCRHNDVDELHYGKMYRYEEIITHYFCMLFSSNMEQNGEDDQGILGFLPKDIKKEVGRGSKLTCSYCQHSGATIGCNVKQCKKKFHYPCGIQHGSLHLFYGQFKSYCYAHRPSQRIPQDAIKLTEKSICVMCQDEVTAKPLPSTVWAACCRTTWLHRNCVQRMAINAGYFFKCPNCNNKDIFRKEMLENGIYIPDQDAAWELEPNAYHELTERYSRCDAVQCMCPNGRNFSEAGNDYEIILCSFCGSQGIHNKCGEDYFDEKGQWTCTSCVSIVKSRTSGVDSSTSTSVNVEDPGPSSTSEKTRSVRQSQNLRKDRCSSSQSQVSNSRKRTLSFDSEDESSCKVPAIELPRNDDENEPLHLLNSSGEHIEVVRLQNINAASVEIGGVKVNNPVNSDDIIVSIDSDDDDDATAPQPVMRPTKKVTPNTAPSIYIDLLDDSDEEEETSLTATNPAPATASAQPQPASSVTNGRVDDDDDDDDDDDVIFVGCDPPEARPPKVDNSTALIRIVDHDRTYIVSPMDIRRNDNIDLFANNNAGNVTINSLNPVRSSFRVLPNDRSFVWQSVPLHKSNANHYPQHPLPQIISAISLGNSIVSNNNAGSNNYISKENESNSWMTTDASEIINLD
ncbi:pineapple eye protein-like [Planococcus citri]|uniref:pineapple eye protein-like n=1 Tax=Planococcus citri TaxID=170843 RepID=UPI0031F86C06